MRDGVPLLQDYLSESARRLPDKAALICDGRRVVRTYAQLEAESNALAHALVQRGVERGDRVIVFAGNSCEAVVAFWAVLKANAVVAMVNPQTKADRLAYLLQDCRATALITEERLLRVAATAAAGAPHLRATICAGQPERARRAPPAGLVSWAEATAGAPRATCPSRRSIDLDLAAIIYTSGSTGDPKGVMLTHRNMLAAATSITAYLENVEDDVILSVLPLAFDYGLYQMIMAFRMGARLVLERSFAHPAPLLRTIVEETVTGFPGVPAIFAVLGEMKELAQYDFSAVRYVTNTAAALPEKHVALLKKIFPASRIYSMYGLPECKRCTYLPPEDLERKPGSVGVAIPNTEMWIVDEQDRRLGPNEVGQLVIRGATVMKGYWEKPEATAQRLRPGPLPGEFVLYTGDYCRLDDEGYLYFVGRMDEMIKSRGEKVPPKEVENALVNIPGVKEAAVVGVPDAVLGAAVQAFVVLEEGAHKSESELIGECTARLKGYMVPTHVELVPSLPKTATGKIEKAELRPEGRSPSAATHPAQAGARTVIWG